MYKLWHHLKFKMTWYWMILQIWIVLWEARKTSPIGPDRRSLTAQTLAHQIQGGSRRPKKDVAEEAISMRKEVRWRQLEKSKKVSAWGRRSWSKKGNTSLWWRNFLEKLSSSLHWMHYTNHASRIIGRMILEQCQHNMLLT